MILSFELVAVDLTKTQFSSEKDDHQPVAGNKLTYRGEVYIHNPENHFADYDYRWDQDDMNPPRPQMEAFALRMELGRSDFEPEL